MGLRTLSKHPPRSYTTLEAFRGRVWRNSWRLYGQECALFSIFIALYSFLLAHDLGFELGILLFLLSSILSALVSLWIGFKRAHIVRTGLFIEGHLISKKKVRLWHEILRAKAHRSFLIRYEFTPPTHTQPIRGKLYLCQCAYAHLDVTQPLSIVYDKHHPRSNLPLKVALMRIPH